MIARLLIVLGLLVLLFDVADFTITGLAVLGAVFIGVGLWLNRVFARETWMADEATSAYCSAVDLELKEKGL